MGGLGRAGVGAGGGTLPDFPFFSFFAVQQTTMTGHRTKEKLRITYQR